MAEAAATYPAGMSVTRTTPPAAPPYAYALALMGAQDKYRTDLSNWSRQNWRPPMYVPRGTNELGAAPVRAMAAPEAPSRPAPAPKSSLERAQERAALLKAKASSDIPPWRYSYGNPNSPSHPEIPIEFLNAFQRQLYLPQNAQMEGNGLSNEELTAPGRQRAESSVAEARAAEAAARAREAEALRDAAIARARYGVR